MSESIHLVGDGQKIRNPSNLLFLFFDDIYHMAWSFSSSKTVDDSENYH